MWEAAARYCAQLQPVQCQRLVHRLGHGPDLSHHEPRAIVGNTYLSRNPGKHRRLGPIHQRPGDPLLAGLHESVDQRRHSVEEHRRRRHLDTIGRGSDGCSGLQPVRRPGRLTIGCSFPITRGCTSPTTAAPVLALPSTRPADNNAGLHIAGAFFDGANIYVGTNKGLLVSSNGGSTFSLASVGGMASDEAMVSFAGSKEAGERTVICRDDERWRRVRRRSRQRLLRLSRNLFARCRPGELDVADDGH